MNKITIVSLNANFIEINYGDTASMFNTSSHIFNKSNVDLKLDGEKTTINVSFPGTTFNIIESTLQYVQTDATTIEEYYTELKSLL